MKTVFFLCLLAPAIQNFETNLDAISDAIRSGNAEALGRYFDDSVDMTILNNEDTYGKAKAVSMVKTFFANHKPSSFKLVHQGVSKGADSKYCIGNLVASSGTYRVYLYMKSSGNEVRIQEMRIEKE